MWLVHRMKLKKDKLKKMTVTIIILAITAAYICMNFITKKMTVKHKIVFAGHPSSDVSNIDISPLPQNAPKYKLGIAEVDMSNLEQLKVVGKSLEPFGIKDGAIVFVKKIKIENSEKELDNLIGRFIVFKIDNERTLKEYPLKNITVTEDGLKLRKVVKIINKRNPNAQNEILDFINQYDTDFQELEATDKRNESDRYLKKFNFAASYYGNDDFLIMSITYKNGEYKDYSFHSPKWIYGIVEYNTK